MTSVFVKADPPAPEALILLKPEPLDSVMGKWLSWILALIVFLLGLIYFSTNFAKVDITCDRKKYDDDDFPNLLSISRHTSSADHVPHLDVGQDAVKPDIAPASSFPDTPASLISSVNRPVVADDSVRTGFTTLAIIDDDDCDEYDVYGNCVAPFTPLAVGGLHGYYGFGGRRFPHPHHRRFPHPHRRH